MYNRLIAAMLTLIAISFNVRAIDSRLNSRGYDLTEPVVIAAGDTLMLTNINENVAMQTFEVGLAPRKSGHHKWQMNLISATDTLSLSIDKTDSNFGDFDHTEGIRIIVRRNNELIDDITVTENISTDARPNYLRADLFPDGIDLSLGHSTLRLATRLPFSSFYSRAEIISETDATVTRRLAAYRPAPRIVRSAYASQEEINEAISQCNHPIAGIWKKFDETFDTTSALIGGNYTIAIVPAPDSGNMMQIIYLDGGITNDKAWEHMMIKGTLSPTPFYSNFDVEWIDALGNEISEGANALVENNLLVIDFPLINARIRFARLPSP